jgi:small subunit ribosomal protein S8
MLDPIAEMLTRIKNAQRAGKFEVRISLSKLKLAIAGILEKEGFIESFTREKEENREYIKIILKYYKLSNTRRVPAITDLKRKSKEGQRMYLGSKEIRTVKNRLGISIISTSKGVLTGEEAKKSGLGGECICEVW